MEMAPMSLAIWIIATSEPETPRSEAISAMSEAPAGEEDKMAWDRGIANFTEI